MDLRICPKVVVPDDEKSMFRLRMNRTKVCVNEPIYWNRGGAQFMEGRMSECQPSSKFKLNLEDFESDKGTELRHTCDGTFCEVGREMCAFFVPANSGRSNLLMWEYCNLHPDSHPLFRRKAETGQIEVNIDRATDDGKWSCLTFGDNVHKGQVGFAEKCDASDARQIVEVLQVEAENGDFFPACYDL
jgi:hypothetical protein